MSARGTIGQTLAATLVAFAILGGAPVLAPAQAPAPADKPAAEKLLEGGLERFDAGDFDGAARAWETLLREHGEATSWRVLYNLGLAYRNAGRIDRAVDRFERFLRRVGAEAAALDAPLEERRQDAAEQVTLLKPKVATLAVRRSAAAGDVMVTIDDHPPRVAGFETYVMPGRHTITVGEGASARRVTVDVVASEVREIDATVIPPPGPAPTSSTPRTSDPPPATRPQSNAGPIAFGVLAGATALSFALPIGLGVHAGNVADAAKSLGRGHTRYDDAVASYEDARSAYYVSYVLPAVLGAATIATFAFVVFAPGADAAGPPDVRASITLLSNGGDPGLAFRCDF